MLKVFPATVKQIENFLNIPEYNDYKYNVEDNSSYVPKSFIVQKLLFQRNVLKKISKAILPSFALREKIRRFLITRNTKTKGYDNKNLVSSVVAQSIYEKYLKEDDTFLKTRSDYNSLK